MGKLFCVGLLRLAEDPPTITVDETTSRVSKISHAVATGQRKRDEGDTDDSSEEEEEQAHSPTEGSDTDRRT